MHGMRSVSGLAMDSEANLELQCLQRCALPVWYFPNIDIEVGFVQQTTLAVPIVSVGKNAWKPFFFVNSPRVFSTN